MKLRTTNQTQQLQSVCRISTRSTKNDDPDPAPWLARKLAVGIVIGLVVYSYYVFIATLVIPSIRQKLDSSWVTPSEAIGLLVGLNLLWLMFIWSYLKVILTSPGFVKDFVKTSPPPPNLILLDAESQSNSSLQPGPPYVSQSVPRASLERPEMIQIENSDSSKLINQVIHQSNSSSSKPIRFDDQIPIHESSDQTIIQAVHSDSQDIGSTSLDPSPIVPDNPNNMTRTIDKEITTNLELPRQEISSTPTSTVPIHPTRSRSPPPHRLTNLSEPSVSPTTFWSLNNTSAQPLRLVTSPQQPVQPSCFSFAQSQPTSLSTTLSQVPSRTRILDLNHRYCFKCKLYKPPRSHHCRHCGTCVLRMDHHCPWIGQCVGARNYKFFINFLQWSTFYTLYVFLVLLIINLRPTHPTPNRQQLSILIISGLFAMFTLTLLITHMYLMIQNLSTIEHMKIEKEIGKENLNLNQVLINQRRKICLKRKILKQLDLEWGHHCREGNPWWINPKFNFEMVMGKFKFGWIFPISAKPNLDTGLNYTLNPRYSNDGIWRKRNEWPIEYQ
ncbi:hypothetical protein CROQUDRAFT_661857 [Cronartium quercuum f. sp. fusiforme G11]|uniref:Palmitoyltransferase n=1 Tax=Cronartium quercuum f. sp. fusiforme G11 TaxID=708437 RepID=A0A9P6NBA1_9BASI|nr:hypothetical protein CROQUDRAFT_661857 [Cronartium quercuum f. sp. fusiforme G11]